MAASLPSENGNQKYYLEEGADGKVRFGTVILIEKKKPITLTGKKS